MRRIFCRSGFSLGELAITLIVLGCLIGLAFGVLNYSGGFGMLDANKQAKLDSVLKSTTSAIMGGELPLNSATACSATVIRDMYKDKIAGSVSINDVTVNGKALPAIKIPNLGVVVFEASTNCEMKWNVAPTSTKTGGSKVEVANAAPVAVYATTDESADSISVPADVVAERTTSAVEDEASVETSEETLLLSANTKAFAVSSVGLEETYVSSSDTILAADTSDDADTQDDDTSDDDSGNSGIINNTEAICAQGEDYSYISKKCTDENGQGLSIEFYQMVNENDCHVSYCPGNGYDYDGNLILTGQINSRCDSESGNVGQCGCPGTKEYYVGEYLHDNSDIYGVCLESCAAVGMVETYEGSKICACPNGSIWNNEAKRCITPGVCPEEYQKWNAATNSCICKTEEELIEMDTHYFGTCEVYDAERINNGCKKLSANWQKINGQCVCPVPFTQSGKICACNNPRTQNGNVCACDFDKVEPTLNDDEIFVNDDYNPTCKIKCDTANYFFPDSTKRQCIQQLPECECLKELDENYNCQCMTYPTEADIAGCQVPDNMYFTGTGTCIAQCDKEYKVRNPQDVRTCICPSEKPAAVVLGQYEQYDPTSVATCKTCNTATTNRVYAAGTTEGDCVCMPQAEMTLTGEEIYRATEANCKFDCSTINMRANSTRTECVPICGCLETLVNGVCVCNTEITTEQIAACTDLRAGHVFDATVVGCQVECKGTSVPADSLKSCACDCLKTYDGNTCVCDPTQANNTTCINADEKFDATSLTCKSCKEDNREYNQNGVCVCKAPAELTFGTNEIYNTSMPTCKYTCKDGATASDNHEACEGNCLEEYDYVTETLKCIKNPSDTLTASCLANTNYISVPEAEVNRCMIECPSLNVPDDRHKACPCDAALVAAELARPGMEAYYVYNNLQDAAMCIARCEGQTLVNADQTGCDPVGCLYKTDDQVTRYCNPNPTDEEIRTCLAGSRDISDPTNTGCRRECPELNSPDAGHKYCPCDAALVAAELARPGREAYYSNLQNPDQCIARCAGQTLVNADQTGCDPVGCLYKTDNQVTRYCNPNPTDEEIRTCLAGTNDKSNPSMPECREACSPIHTADVSHKMCVCDFDKKEGHYSADNMKYDETVASTCESLCPSFTLRNPADSRTCVCPDVQPSSGLTIQAGYFYHSFSPVISGQYACQIKCPAKNSPAEVEMWLENHEDSFTSSKIIYDDAGVGCLGTCEGNYISTDKLTCICPLTNASCGAGTYFDAASCSCKPCTKGHYCPGGTQPIECPCGTYGAIEGLQTDACSGQCQAGYYCPQGSISATAAACQAGQACPTGTCTPQICDFPSTSVAPYTVCNVCRTEAVIRQQNPNYIASNEVYSTDLSLGCKTCYSYLEYNSQGLCQCPAVQPGPNQPSVQAGYYYNPSSVNYSGTYMCQTACPTDATQKAAWVRSHAALFTSSKVVYDNTKVSCLGQCTGNLITNDKLTCICPLTNASCGAGTYFDAASCSCKPCTKGHYCPGGTQPIECPCGTYGAIEGLKTAACSGQCRAGYRCPAASISATAVACQAGQACPTGTCTPQMCDFPSTSTSPYTACNTCRTEAVIKAERPNYFGANEIYVNNLATGCKTCKSNMVYNAQGQCVCPAAQPYWNGTSCQKCQVWGTLYFARQEKDNPSCTLYNHLNGSQNSGCFTTRNRIPDPGMARAASLLSNADKNRTFGNGVYAYMVALSPDGKSASVVGVFTARTWYKTFPGDNSSYTTNKNTQVGGTCQEMCAGNAECVNTCNYMHGKVANNTMFNSCKYVLDNQFYGNQYGAADELCVGGQITMSNQCQYNVGGLMRRVTSPLVLDLNGNGFDYTSTENGVEFDLDADGNMEQTAWTNTQQEFDNAFLVLDKNDNGQVDNGSELFGDQNGSDNGFLELAKYDSNSDGVINTSDEVYTQLLLWADLNKNAKVDYDNDGTTSELKTLPEAGVTELSITYRVVLNDDGSVKTDANGNVIGFVGTFKMMIADAAGKLVEVVRTMMDVFFATVQSVFN